MFSCRYDECVDIEALSGASNIVKKEICELVSRWSDHSIGASPFCVEAVERRIVFQSFYSKHVLRLWGSVLKKLGTVDHAFHRSYFCKENKVWRKFSAGDIHSVQILLEFKKIIHENVLEVWDRE